jgi:hypothetical protein
LRHDIFQGAFGAGMITSNCVFREPFKYGRTK